MNHIVICCTIGLLISILSGCRTSEQPASTFITPGSRRSGALDLATCTDGSYYLVGFGTSNKVNTSDSTTMTQYSFVAKYDSLDQLVWRQIIDGSGKESINAVSAKIDGGCYITGYTTSRDGNFDYIVNDSSGQELVAFVMNLDANGRVLGRDYVRNNSWILGRDIATLAGGGCIVAVETLHGTSSTSVSESPNACFWGVRYDTLARNISRKKLYADQNYRTTSVTTVSSKAVLMLGSRDAKSTALYFDSTLALQWRHNFDSMGIVKARSVCVSDDGYFFLTGAIIKPSNNPKGKPQQSNDRSGIRYADAFAMKLDSLGEAKWLSTVAGVKDDVATCVIAVDGGCIIVGNTNSADTTAVAEDRTSQDSFVARFDRSGSRLWITFLKGSGTDYATSITQKKNGTFLIAGSTSSTDGDYGNNRIDETDAFLILIDQEGNVLRR